MLSTIFDSIMIFQKKSKQKKNLTEKFRASDSIRCLIFDFFMCSNLFVYVYMCEITPKTCGLDLLNVLSLLIIYMLIVCANYLQHQAHFFFRYLFRKWKKQKRTALKRFGMCFFSKCTHIFSGYILRCCGIFCFPFSFSLSSSISLFLRINYFRWLFTSEIFFVYQFIISNFKFFYLNFFIIIVNNFALKSKKNNFLNLHSKTLFRNYITDIDQLIWSNCNSYCGKNKFNHEKWMGFYNNTKIVNEDSVLSK